MGRSSAAPLRAGGLEMDNGEEGGRQKSRRARGHALRLQRREETQVTRLARQVRAKARSYVGFHSWATSLLRISVGLGGTLDKAGVGGVVGRGSGGSGAKDTGPLRLHGIESAIRGVEKTTDGFGFVRETGDAHTDGKMGLLGFRSRSSQMRRVTKAAEATPVSGRTTANSSPPWRAAVSVSRQESLRICASLQRARLPAR